MANIAPTDIFTGYEIVSAAGAVTADSIVIPLSNFPHLSSAEYDADTGDGRELARQLDIKIDTAINSLAEIDRPTKMTTSVTSTTLNTGNRRINVTRTYEVEAPLDQLEMVSEV